MFDSITVNTHTGSDVPDFGLVAEALIFYDKVNFIVGPVHLMSLLRVFGHEVLRELFDMSALSLTYLENHAGIRTSNGGTANEAHQVITFGSPSQLLQNILPETLRELIGKEGKSRRVSEALKRHIATLRHPESINGRTLDDISSRQGIRESVASTLRFLVPEYPLPNPFQFNVMRHATELRVSTNIDFSIVNSFYHQRVDPKHSTITPAFLLSYIHAVTGDLEIAASVNSEIALSPASLQIVTAKLESLVKRTQSDTSIGLFQELVFNDARAVREAINHGNKSMKDVLDLVRRAREFKSWVKSKPEDTDLRKAYVAEVSKLGWSEKLPPRVCRFGIFGAASTALSFLATPTAGAVAGLALSAVDYFLLDRLASGWKPNQFVYGPLLDFVRTGRRVA
jgi:hypothetical protein